MVQIRDELVYNNIRLYPFDTDENDEEEIQLNESIRVSRYSASRLWLTEFTNLSGHHPVCCGWFRKQRYH